MVELKSSFGVGRDQVVGSLAWYKCPGVLSLRWLFSSTFSLLDQVLIIPPSTRPSFLCSRCRFCRDHGPDIQTFSVSVLRGPTIPRRQHDARSCCSLCPCDLRTISESRLQPNGNRSWDLTMRRGDSVRPAETLLSARGLPVSCAGLVNTLLTNRTILRDSNERPGGLACVVL